MGDAPTAVALRSASVTVSNRRGAGPIRLSWRLDTSRAQFHANTSVPFGFEKASLTMILAMPPEPPHGALIKESAAVTIILREKRSGLVYSINNAHSGPKAAALRDSGVLRLSMSKALGDLVGDRHATAELTILPGEYEFELAVTVGQLGQA